MQSDQPARAGQGEYSVIPQEELSPPDRLTEPKLEPRQISDQTNPLSDIETPKPETIEELHEIYGKWLAISEDFEALDIIFATMLDRLVSGDPLWLFIVGPSGATKTELLRSLFSQELAFQLSSLTSKTIVSGKEKPSGKIVKGLFPKMTAHVVVIPELSQVLTKERTERDAIFGQLRDLYDGHCTFGYGTLDEPIVVDCSIGLVCGVTSAIDMYGSVHAVLGERFLKVRPKFDRDKAREQALLNKGNLERMRLELQSAADYFLKKLTNQCANFRMFPDLEPQATAEQQGKIGLYAEFVAYVRTTVTSQAFREYDTSEWSPQPEFATRLSQQLLKLAQCLAVVRGHASVTDEDLRTVSRVALDTCIPNRLAIIKTLYQTEQPLSIKETAERAGLCYRKAWTSLETPTVIGGIVEETHGEKQHNERFYELTEKFRKLTDQSVDVIHLVDVRLSQDRRTL